VSDPNQKYEYFIEQTNKRLESMDHKLDDLFVFKWKVVGASGLASLLITVLVEVIFRH
jgi:hypothetical protein